MKKKINMNNIPNKYKQQGFSLFMVMIIMVVIALLVVITNQMTTTETRLGANEADRKFAFTAAESGLRDGEEALAKLLREAVAAASDGKSSKLKTFTASCKGGYCAPSEKVIWVNEADSPFEIPDTDNGKEPTPAWERTNTLTGTQANSLVGTESSKVRFIIEYLGEKQSSGSKEIRDYFRITSRATGENANTVVMLQSYVEMTRQE